MEPLTKTFEIVRGELVRTVVPRRGRPYVQRCDRASFEDVVRTVEDRGDDGITTNELWEALPDVPCSRVSVAFDFLKERGCVVVEGRRSYAASGALFEDALCEWHALTDVGRNPVDSEPN